ncbi:MAG: hypothetical protein IJ876_00485 [Elusimicrobiaceae bacterium]|nr:hypothetical protein [Elusimicrobiaceae bacterium]
MYVLLLSGLSTPVKAAPSSCASAQNMLRSSNNPSWRNSRCVLLFARYIRNLDEQSRDQIARRDITVLREVSNAMKDRLTALRREQGQSAEWESWYNAYNTFARSFGETAGAYVWDKSQQAYVLEDRVEQAVNQQVQQAVVLPGWPRKQAWPDIAGANKNVTNLQGLLDLMVQRVQAGADLTPFIELIVNEGKPNKADPHYVSDDVINTAFLLYAYSIPANRADQLLTYTDRKYAARVRFAAASAAAEFAKNRKTRNGKYAANEPSGRLTLSDSQREQILWTLEPVYDNAKTELTRLVVQYRLSRVYENMQDMHLLHNTTAQSDTNMAVFAPAIALTPTLAEMFAAQASAYAASIGMEVTSGFAALQGAMASGATAAAGEVLIVTAPVIVFGVALDDAFAPTYRAAFENKLRESLRVETVPAATVMEDAYTQAFDGTYMVETLTNTRTEAATKTQVQQTAPCIHQYSSQMNAACPSFEAIPLQGTFKEAYKQNPVLIQSKFITGGASQGALRLALKNPAELAQLEQIWQERCSFMTKIPTGVGTQSARRGFVRATYYAGRWIPTVEASIMTGINIDRNGGVNDQGGPSKKNLPMKKFLAFIKSWANADLTNLTYGIMKRQNFKPQQVGNVWVRNGIHQDRSKPTPDHIHIEKICAYTPGSVAVEMCQFNPTAPSIGKNLYQCNLSLQYK